MTRTPILSLLLNLVLISLISTSCTEGSVFTQRTKVDNAKNEKFGISTAPSYFLIECINNSGRLHEEFFESSFDLIEMQEACFGSADSSEVWLNVCLSDETTCQRFSPEFINAQSYNVSHFYTCQQASSPYARLDPQTHSGPLNPAVFFEVDREQLECTNSQGTWGFTDYNRQRVCLPTSDDCIEISYDFIDYILDWKEGQESQSDLVQSDIDFVKNTLKIISHDFKNILNSYTSTSYIFGEHRGFLARGLGRKIRSGNYGWLPKVEIFSKGRINQFDAASKFVNFVPGENQEYPDLQGAYDSATQTVYINKAVLESTVENELKCVLVQELAHHIDKLIGGDSRGAEGLLAVNKICHPDDQLSVLEHNAFRKHDDKANINLTLLDGTELSLQNVELGFWKNLGIIALVTVSVAVATTGVGAVAEWMAAGGIIEAEVAAAVAAESEVVGYTATAFAAEGEEAIGMIELVELTEEVEAAGLEIVEANAVIPEITEEEQAFVSRIIEKSEFRNPMRVVTGQPGIASDADIVNARRVIAEINRYGDAIITQVAESGDFTADPGGSVIRGIFAYTGDGIEAQIEAIGFNGEIAEGAVNVIEDAAGPTEYQFIPNDGSETIDAFMLQFQ